MVKTIKLQQKAINDLARTVSAINETISLTVKLCKNLQERVFKLEKLTAPLCVKDGFIVE